VLHTLTGHTDSVRSVAYRPDGAQLASAGDDNTIRVWDAATGEPAGWRAVYLPAGELAVWDATTDELVGASPGAWYWLGWTTTIDGNLTRLPAETYGPLPPLSPAEPPPTPRAS
jgi:WD40 repeat protein